MRSYTRPTSSRFDGNASMASARTASAAPPAASESMAKLYMSRGGASAAPSSGKTRTTGSSSARSDDSASSVTSSSNPHAQSSSTGSAPLQTNQENYFRFTEKHQELLLAQSRRNAAGLVVDALYDPAKWRFLAELKATSSLQDAASVSDESRFITPPQQNLEVFELKPQAIDRVACVAPKLASDPQQLLLRSHTLLAKTRVRGKLDEFMAWMTTRRRVVHQGMMNTLHEGHLQHCDVFSGFDAENPQNPQELEKFALKYFIVEPTAASLEALKTSTVSPHSGHAAAANITKPVSSKTANATTGTSTTKRFGFLRRKESSDLNDPVLQQQAPQQSAPDAAARVPEERMHFCMGEYSAVRKGVPLQSTGGSNATVEDQRIGIISYHSVEDPELLQLCNSIANKTTPRSLSQCTSRTLLQYSGIVAYPVASETDDGADYLEVIIKVSCFDSRGLSAAKKASMFTFVSAFRNLAHMMLVMRLRASPFLTTTNWVADERRKCCLVCQQRFSSLRRRHHCRLCGEVTCAKCSTVHQVRLVKEAKASLRICLLCIQGVDKPKWRDHEREKAVTKKDNNKPQAQIRDAPSKQRRVSQEDAHEDGNGDSGDDRTRGYSEDVADESNPIDLLNFSLVKDLEKQPQSPSSSTTDTSSPVEPLLQSHGPAMTEALEADPGLDHTIRQFHDSAFDFSFQPPPKDSSQPKDLPEELSILQNLMGHFDDDDEEDEDEDEDERGSSEVLPTPVVSDSPKASPVSTSAVKITLYEEEEEQEREENITVRRLSDDDDEIDGDEDDDDARLHCLAAYGMLETKDTIDGVIPEDLALQTIVKEAAQLMDCAIAAIGFVDASRDMVCATYSASPLCQVPRGVLPKQYSLTWEVMRRATGKPIAEQHSVFVLDVGKDAVLRGNPFVLDAPFVRFMVGVPIRSWNGVIIGAIMVADIQPRAEVSSEHTSALKNYAALVESWLENVRQEVMAKANPSAGTHSEKLQDRLAEMLHTSYKTNLELQMRSMQMKQQQPPASTGTTATSAPKPASKLSQPIRHVLF